MKNDDHNYNYGESGRGTGLFVTILVALALLAIGYLVFASFDEAEAANLPTNSITNIQPSKAHLGCSISEAVENEGVCISKELILSD